MPWASSARTASAIPSTPRPTATCARRGAFCYAIKPLAAAERDGDQIHAVVEATAVNAAGAADGADGLTQGRYITAPTRHAQVALMRTASARAGRAPQDFDYIEAHATGTVVGDRIEGNANTEAFGGAERDAPLRISSVKSNVGHMEAAAFHCALLKVILMLRHRTFAPTSRSFLAPNPEIDFDGCPMQVQTSCDPLSRATCRCRHQFLRLRRGQRPLRGSRVTALRGGKPGPCRPPRPQAS